MLTSHYCFWDSTALGLNSKIQHAAHLIQIISSTIEHNNKNGKNQAKVKHAYFCGNSAK